MDGGPPPSRSRGSAAVMPALLAAAVAGGLTVNGLTWSSAPGVAAAPRVEVGGAPVGIAATPGRVWVVDRRSTGIRVFDARTLVPMGRGFRPDVPGTAVTVGITATPRHVWAAYAHATDDRGWLADIGPGERRVRVTPLPTAPAAVSPGARGTLTIVSRRGEVMRFSGGRVRRVLGPPARAQQADGRDGTWVVASPGSGDLPVLLQLQLRLRLAMPMTSAPGVVAAPGGAWVPGGCGPRLAWADAAAARLRCTGVPATLVAPGPPGSAWAVVGRRRLVRVDTTGREADRLPLTLSPTAIAARGSTVWLASERGGLTRVDAAAAGDGH